MDKSKNNFAENKRRSQIYESFKKVTSMPEDTKIYLYKGHGRDLCEFDRAQVKTVPLEKIVPDNCIYVTFTECGIVGYRKDEQVKTFASKNKEIQKVLRYPYLPGNKKKLAELLQISDANIHIHYPGMSYIVNSFAPFSLWLSKLNDKEETLNGIDTSGLCEKKALEILGNTSQWEFTSRRLDAETNKIIDFAKNINLNKIYSKKEIQQIYDREFTEKFKNSTDELVKKYLEALQNEFDLLTEGKETFPRMEVNEIFSNLRFLEKARKSKLLEKFKTSVFPTEKEVKTYLDKTFPDKMFFNSKDLEQINEYLRNNFLKEKVEQKNINEKIAKKIRYSVYKHFPTTEILMEMYPGIHYINICRSIHDEKCEDEQISLRRSRSSTQELNRESIHTEEENKITKQIKDYYEVIAPIADLSYMQDKGHLLKRLEDIFKQKEDVLKRLDNSIKEKIINYIFYISKFAVKADKDMKHLKKMIGLYVEPFTKTEIVNDLRDFLDTYNLITNKKKNVLQYLEKYQNDLQKLQKNEKKELYDFLMSLKTYNRHTKISFTNEELQNIEKYLQYTPSVVVQKQPRTKISVDDVFNILEGIRTKISLDDVFNILKGIVKDKSYTTGKKVDEILKYLEENENLFMIFDNDEKKKIYNYLTGLAKYTGPQKIIFRDYQLKKIESYLFPKAIYEKRGGTRKHKRIQRTKTYKNKN